MPISASQIVWRYTHPDTRLAASRPNISLGGFVSSTPIRSGALHNVFDEVYPEENADGSEVYRCIVFINTHPQLTFSSIRAWFSKIDTRGFSIHAGVDPNGAQSISAFVAKSIPNQNVAPEGVTFHDARSRENGLLLPSLPSEWAQAIWLRRRGKLVGSVNPEINVLCVGGITLM